MSSKVAELSHLSNNHKIVGKKLCLENFVENVQRDREMVENSQSCTNVAKFGNSNVHRVTSTSSSSSSHARSDEYTHPSSVDTALAADSEPLTFKQAMSDDNSVKWQQAIKAELDAHTLNNTWTLIPRRDGMNVIGTKWLFKEKRDETGNTVKYKARLVAQGFKQEHVSTMKKCLLLFSKLNHFAYYSHSLLQLLDSFISMLKLHFSMQV